MNTLLSDSLETEPKIFIQRTTYIYFSNRIMKKTRALNSSNFKEKKSACNFSRSDRAFLEGSILLRILVFFLRWDPDPVNLNPDPQL